MPTPVSGSDPYCTGLQFVARYDARTVAEMLTDEATPISVSDVPTNQKLIDILMSMSGKVEAAAGVGGKYSPTDLAALTGNMKQWLATIVADLAAPQVLGRRFVEFPDFKQRLDEANAVLGALSDGTMIFGIQENIDAGVIDSEVETPEVVEARQMITYQARKFFGRRANRSTS